MSDVETQLAELPRLLGRAGRAIARSEQRRAAAGHGLTRTAAGVLRWVDREGPTAHRDLAVAVGVAPATLTAVVDALERRGAVVRVRDRADRRVVRVSITPAGAALLGDDMSAGRRDLPHPGPAEAAVVRHYLEAVLAALDDPGPTPPP